ncbi:MAG TPA: SH3 domain-containing protein [Pseudonocardiaceae bacterium]|nr:SH3 domain-containing protein [Pseudonocardiaceae bacterium]
MWKFVQKNWLWVVAGAVVVYVLALNPTPDSAAGESVACTMKVTADVLNVRSGPGTNNRVVGRLAEGDLVPADRTVTNGFRQLGSGRWAAQRYLDRVPGCNCG